MEIDHGLGLSLPIASTKATFLRPDFRSLDMAARQIMFDGLVSGDLVDSLEVPLGFLRLPNTAECEMRVLAQRSIDAILDYAGCFGKARDN